MDTGFKSYWSRGDFNGFIGFFTNIMVNILVLTGILMFSVGISADIVIGRILPGVGIGIAFGNIYYAYMARRIGRKTGRSDLTALPYGPSVGHLFVVTYIVIGPVYWTTHDPILAWQAGLAWCVLESVIEVAGAFIGKKIQNITPRAAMLGNMAGLSITLIAMKPIAQIYGTPLIGIICVGFILIGFFSKKKLPFGIPAAGWMALFGAIIGWSTGHMQLSKLQFELSMISFSFPRFAFAEIFTGFKVISPFLISVIPLGIGNALSTLNNVESAEAAGDSFNVKETMIVDGIGSFIGCIFGNPYPTTVYIGHPGYKDMGARNGYSIATGIATLIVCLFGLTPVFLAIVPIEALMPILLFIGLVMGAQAFQASPKEHAPAIMLAMIPWIAQWVITIINNTLMVAGTNPFAEGMIQKLQGVDIWYLGLLSLSQGAIITGMTLSMITVFLIDGKFVNAAIASLSLAVLAFFGFVHSQNIGVNMAPYWMIGYLMVAAVILIVKIYNDKFVSLGGKS
jgi:AGZA family xanthine/uracil permease-like MFS transporter